ncbi:hypothetical protein ACQ4LE_004340 [Meloidogyne hapla]|uniref:Glucosidase 2 subunit beta n=1 Tax=Meloidogyne hapla TaxID=6305 RepID=A0A1I8C093_MELHA
MMITRYLFVFILFHNLFVLFAEDSSTKTLLPRGVYPQLASFYSGGETFACLDGNKVIPFNQVNDDYCDCADGSDEPGTAACRNGKFYCSNYGYKPSLIPSSRVNDYICDCCDGSDEWDSGIECPNICEALGSEARSEAKQRRVTHEAGWRKREELALEGKKIMEEKTKELEKQKGELSSLEQRKLEMEEAKNVAEKLESDAKREVDEQWEIEKNRKLTEKAENLLKQIDNDGNGKISNDELRIYAGLEPQKLLPPENKLNEESENVDNNLLELEEMLKGIFVEGNENIDLEILKNKFKNINDFLIKCAEKKQKENEEDGKEENEEKEDEIDGPKYDEETQKLIENANIARKEFEEVESQIGQFQDDIRNSEQFLNQEYGTDYAWAPLKGQCAELTTTQYTYKICLFDRTIQKDRNGHNEVDLGHWGNWSGPEINKFSLQKYEHGQSCWNGPERSTLVELVCGAELELVEASEPAKCEYKFLVRAPAACQDLKEMDVGESHFEL